jgi:hypothetical protein
LKILRAIGVLGNASDAAAALSSPALRRLVIRIID